jgi:hypothetical protein
VDLNGNFGQFVKHCLKYKDYGSTNELYCNKSVSNLPVQSKSTKNNSYIPVYIIKLLIFY